LSTRRIDSPSSHDGSSNTSPLCPRTIAISSTPCARNVSSVCLIIGLPAIGAKHFGVVSVKGSMRDPSPAARITAW